MFSESQLGHWRKVLLHMRERLDGDSTQIREEALHASGGEGSGELSSRSLHPADAGSEETGEVETIGLAENEALLVRQVEDALTRIREKSFGMCESCSKTIPRARLTVVPYARHCISCAQSIESQKRRGEVT